MEIKLAYGRTGLNVRIPEPADVLTPKFIPGLRDARAAIREALRDPIGLAPLAELVKPGDSVVIVHTDITRATPNDLILPVLLDELEKAGIAPKNITLLNGLGTHRAQTENELRSMLGDRIVDGYRCQQHNCSDEVNLVSLA